MTAHHIITIDGPSGVGKGALAMAMAEYFDFDILDSGALYRLICLRALQQKKSFDDVHALIKLTQNLPVVFERCDGKIKILLDGVLVNQNIRTEEIAKNASQIAAMPKVRIALLDKQRDYAKGRNLIADGRDMGSVVFPQASVKIFLTANIDERVKRRVKQLRDANLNANIHAVWRDMEKRDERDKNRSISPLSPADDAILINSSNLSLAEVIEKAKSIISKRI